MLNNAENNMFVNVLLTWAKHLCKSQLQWKKFIRADIHTAEHSRCPASEQEEGEGKFDISVVYAWFLYVF